MLNDEHLMQQYIDHEVRIRMQENNYKELRQTVNDIQNLVRWSLATLVVSIIIPICLKYFNIM